MFCCKVVLFSNCSNLMFFCQNIRIYHECEGGIEKKMSRGSCTNWHHKVCSEMTNCDPEGRKFSFSCSPLNTTFLLQNKLREVPEYADM